MKSTSSSESSRVHPRPRCPEWVHATIHNPPPMSFPVVSPITTHNHETGYTHPAGATEWRRGAAPRVTLRRKVRPRASRLLARAHRGAVIFFLSSRRLARWSSRRRTPASRAIGRRHARNPDRSTRSIGVDDRASTTADDADRSGTTTTRERWMRRKRAVVFHSNASRGRATRRARSVDG